MKTQRKMQQGATMVEYAMMVVLIAAVAVASVALLGAYTGGMFDNTTAEMQAAGMSAPGGS